MEKQISNDQILSGKSVLNFIVRSKVVFYWSHGVMVSTLDFESSDPSSSLVGTLYPFSLVLYYGSLFAHLIFTLLRMY